MLEWEQLTAEIRRKRLSKWTYAGIVCVQTKTIINSVHSNALDKVNFLPSAKVNFLPSSVSSNLILCSPSNIVVSKRYHIYRVVCALRSGGRGFISSKKKIITKKLCPLSFLQDSFLLSLILSKIWKGEVCKEEDEASWSCSILSLRRCKASGIIISTKLLPFCLVHSCNFYATFKLLKCSVSTIFHSLKHTKSLQKV